MKHMSTWDLLDLAEDVKDFAKEYHGNVHSLATATRLTEIDTELLSRMPEGEFVTVYDWVNKDIPVVLTPVGFEPYIGEDNEYDSHLSLDGFNRQGFYD